ncbi:MAG: PHP domain-containing protein [Candidatus Aminicenantes bacterium]|nr:PHP domain-containing protein [Candidatus Aminicenantes bacterium]
MDFTKIDLNSADLHIHTIASDGEMRAEEIIEASEKIGLKTISITDHDGVSAYSGGTDVLKEKAGRRGLDLIPGIELDSEYMGVEIHILGYGIDVTHPVLSEHLSEVQSLRKKRIREIMDKVNINLGEKTLTDEMIFPPGRETLMKPHIVRELLKNNTFNKYKDASKWIAEKCKPETIVPKLPPEVIIPVILKAGGTPVLAHPAYYLGINGIELDKKIAELSALGLEGVEVFYDYHGLSPSMFNKKDYQGLISMISNVTEKYGLFATRGSDSHTLEELADRNPPRLIP